MLGETHLEPDEKARMSGMDLPNAYHHAGVSVPRAKTYAVGGRVASSAFARGAAFERMVQRRRAAGPSSRSADGGACSLAKFGNGGSERGLFHDDSASTCFGVMVRRGS